MAKEVSKVIPVAERIIEFETYDIRINDFIINCSDKLISEKEWNEFAENALVIVDGLHIVQYVEEYPIVHYKCDEVASVYLKGKSRLNAFIESITVSTARHGKKAGFGTGKLKCEITDFDTVVYYTDHAGINHAIIQEAICYILL